jgi:hypothetical protein
LAFSILTSVLLQLCDGLVDKDRAPLNFIAAEANKLHPGSLAINGRRVRWKRRLITTSLPNSMSLGARHLLSNRRLLLHGFAAINRHGERFSRNSTQDIEEATVGAVSNEVCRGGNA